MSGHGEFDEWDGLTTEQLAAIERGYGSACECDACNEAATDVPDPEPTPLDALAAAAVAWEAAVRFLDNGEWPYAVQVQANLHSAAIAYARSVRG